jgi:hypothetical protein
MTRRFATAFAWLCLALGLAACSSATLTRLAYNNAAFAYGNLGSMLTWMVDDYVDIDGAREDWVRARLDRVVAWHRAEELPRDRAFLESVRAKSEAPFRVEDIAAHQREVRAGYYRVMEQVIPDTAEFLATLGPDEIARIERKFADDNRRFVRDSVRGTPDERLERRISRFIGHLESWVGPGAGAPRALVHERYRELADHSEQLLGERRFRQTELLALVRAKPPRPQMEAGLRRIYVETDSWRNPEYAQKLRERDLKVHTMIADLSATLSERQRAALQKRIRGFLRDISNLTATSAAQRPRATAAS